MMKWTRRDLLKTSLLAPTVAAVAQGTRAFGKATGDASRAPEGSGPLPAGAAPSPEIGVGRERLLLDFGWRFHFGHADDPRKDFGFGSGRAGNFQKTGNFLPAGALAFDDGDWRSLNLPHDWAIELI